MGTPLTTLSLAKAGDTKKILSLNLTKDESFVVKGKWDGAADVDLHAIVTTGAVGEQPMLSMMEQILSAYNVIRTVKGKTEGILPKEADGTFSILGGALVHSPDATSGELAGDDEFIRINPGKLTKVPGQIIEIPIIVMIHPQKPGMNFSQVKNPEITIEREDGTVLMHANLSTQFGTFIGVQMGSIMIDENGVADFIETATGFTGDFMSVINHFAGQ